MKHMVKKIAVIAMMLALMLLFTACGTTKQVVATVGEGKNMVEVTLTELTNYFQNYLSEMQNNYGYSMDISSDETRLALVGNLLDQCVENAVEIYKAREAGIELTAEEEAQCKEKAAADYDSLWQSCMTAARQQGATDVEPQAKKLLTNMLVANGMTVKSMKARYLESEIDTVMVSKNHEKAMEGIEATEEVLKGLFDEEIASQTEAITDTASYFNQQMLADYGYGYQPYVIPEGLFYVRHILVTDEETAKDIKAKIDAGEDFDALLKENNTDVGEPDEGYVCGDGANFVPEFLQAALALENEGDVSEPVQSQYGYHIIKRLGTVEPKTMTYEEAGEGFTALASESYLSEQYAGIVSGWVAEEGLVKTFPEVYENVGK